jgi:alkanesulfonate monooxygenase SsuD/methylene tetrahydromethanopterin reductase-like flavin-dependent oxidoreductase (luciferase family)
MAAWRAASVRTSPNRYIVGSPDQVVEKILLQHQIFGHQRTLFQLAIGSGAVRI